jgi:hypothetical protein
MKLKDLFEMPIADISFHGDDRATNFTDAEKKLMYKYAVQGTYHEKLKKLPMDLYVYVVHDDALSPIGRRFPEGEIVMDTGNGDGTYKGQSPEDGPHIDAALSRNHIYVQLQRNAEKDPNAVHLIMGDNYGGDNPDNQINLTPWMLAHRLVHAISSTAKNDLAMPLSLDIAIITLSYMGLKKTSREKGDSMMIALGRLFNIRSLATGKTDFGEASTELAAKYLVTGELKPIESVYDELVSHMKPMHQTALWRQILKFTQEFTKELDGMMAGAKGRVFYI